MVRDQPMHRFIALLTFPALLSSACTPVSGYTGLVANIRNSSEVALIASQTDPTKPIPAPGSKGLHYLRDVTVLPAGPQYQDFTLESESYKVELRREHGGIRYETSVGTSGVLLGDPESRSVDLDLSAIEALKPSTPLEWNASIRLDTTDHKFTSEGSSSIEHSIDVKLATTWANVRQVTGREVKSPVVGTVAICAAIASYLVGAALIASQVKVWKDNSGRDEGQKKPISGTLIGTGTGLIVLGIPLIIFGVKDSRTHQVVVYGEDKGQRIKLKR